MPSFSDKQTERWLSVAGGGVLTFAASRRGWLGRVLLGGAGAALLYRGVRGRTGVSEMVNADGQASSGRIEIDESVTVYDKSPREVYGFWRDVENLPRFMRHLESVEDRGEGRSHWTAQIPKGLGAISWEAEITDDEPGKRIAWQSLPEADVENSGAVRFREAPGGRGTEVTVQISYHVPGGPAGTLAGKLFNPANEHLIRADVRRFKHLMESGEVPTIDGQPTGA